MFQELKKNVIGHIAFEWLNQLSEMIVQGITSKGIFLKSDNNRVVFLTNSLEYGPLNIFGVSELPDFWKLHDKLQVKISEQKLSLTHGSNTFELEPYKIWTIPPPPDFVISHEEQERRLHKAIQQIELLKGNEGFGPLLNLLKGESSIILPPNLVEIWSHITKLRFAILHHDAQTLLFHAKALSGYGRGLTPSGDDFLNGLFFTLNRINFDSRVKNFLSAIQPQILNIANEKTNSISQSLLSCATIGSADYRIQKMVDTLSNETILFEDQAIQLTRYGNSSGADLFLGIAIGIQIIQESIKET